MKVYVVVEDLSTTNLGMAQLISNAFATKELAQERLESWRSIAPYYKTKELVIWELDVITKHVTVVGE